LFKGPAVPANQVHDFHPPISPAGLYWVAPVPEGSLIISPDGHTATLEMKNVSIIDQPTWPSMTAETHPAFLDFKLVWKAGPNPVKYEDAGQQFRFTGYEASAQLEASVRVPSLDFSWKSDSLETSKADFAAMGEEVNGRYYSA
jgi:hypothetical protein